MKKTKPNTLKTSASLSIALALTGKASNDLSRRRRQPMYKPAGTPYAKAKGALPTVTSRVEAPIPIRIKTKTHKGEEVRARVERTVKTTDCTRVNMTTALAVANIPYSPPFKAIRQYGAGSTPAPRRSRRVMNQPTERPPKMDMRKLSGR